MTLKVCTYQDCGTLSDASRCATHRARPNDHARDQRRKRDGRTRAAWQRTRTIVLREAGHRCHSCGGYATTVHKINGGYHDGIEMGIGQYLALCRECHGRIDAQARKGGSSQRRLPNAPSPAQSRTNPAFLGGGR